MPFCATASGPAAALTDLARRYYGPGVTVRIGASEAPVRKTRTELREMAAGPTIITADADPVEPVMRPAIINESRTRYE